MLKFNENHIFGNYIKQLLKEFNLPHYNNGNWANDVPNYCYNQKIKNITRNLKIDSNIYDSHTHEYLGEYLRFYRDYNKINLMPLYNCFSNNLCSSLSLEIKLSKNKSVNISTNITTHKIYMSPIKLDREYTVAIDSDLPIEMWCGIYDKYQINELKDNYSSQSSDTKTIDLPSLTYKVYNNLQFNNPILFDDMLIDTLVNDARFNIATQNMSDLDTKERKKITKEILNRYEDNLKLFIRIPIDNESSITILEGNYVNFNNYIYDNVDLYAENKNTNIYKRYQNMSIINIEAIDKYPSDFMYITNLQLLRGNTHTSYPFADRLIEYLVGNVITSQEEISDNILRIQAVMEKNNIKFKPYEKGIWQNRFRPYLYNKMYSSTKLNSFADNHDILGYVDKETEKYYDYDPDNNEKTKNSISIARVDIYPNIYKDSKK